jgi:hypothetical protein
VNKIDSRATMLALILMAPVLPAATIVIPAGLAGVEGTSDTSPLGQDGSGRFQQVFGASLLGGLAVGDVINGLTFRVIGLADDGVPAQIVPEYEIRLSQSVNAPGSLSMTFANNRGADEVIVRSGQLIINAGDFPATPNPGPEPFGTFIAFTTPYTYQGGNLLLEIAYSGFAIGRGSSEEINNAAGQQIFTFQQANPSQATADFSETGVFVTALNVNASNVPEPGTWVLFLAGAGLTILAKVRGTFLT